MNKLVASLSSLLLGLGAVGCSDGDGGDGDEAKPTKGGVVLVPVVPPEAKTLWPLPAGWKLVVHRDRGAGKGVPESILDVTKADEKVRVEPFAGEVTRFTLTLIDENGALKARAMTAPAFVDQAGPDRTMHAFLAPAGGGAQVVTLVDAEGKPIADSGRLGEAVAVASSGELFFTGGGVYAGGPPCDKGAEGAPTKAIERLDPSTHKRTKVNASMSQARSFHTATAIGGARVIVAGGYAGPKSTGPTKTVDMLRTNQSTIKAAPVPMARTRARHCAAAVDGRVIFAGGDGQGAGRVELWDPGSGPTAETTLVQPRRDAQCAILTDPVNEKVQLWVLGGALSGGGPVKATVDRIEVITIDGSSITPAGFLQMPFGQISLGAIATPLSPRGVLVAGGFGPGGPSDASDAVWWHPLPGTAWATGDKLSIKRGCAAVASFGSRLLLAGGMTPSGEPADTVDVIDADAVKPKLAATRKLPAARAAALATTMHHGGVLLSGGVRFVDKALKPANTLLWMWP